MDKFRLIEERFPMLERERDFSFAKHTTVGSGGIAAIALSPKTAEEAATCISYLKEQNVPYCFLGAGANVLPRDGRFEGVVIRFHRMKKLYTSGGEIYAEAGVTGGELLAFAEQNRVTGYELFTGIPMTVGGGIAMNAGVPNGHFCDRVISVTAYDGEIKTYSLEECAFSEKNSVFLSGIAVLGARLKAEEADAEEIKIKTAYYRERRKRLPKGRSMGCTFVNPKGVSAGELIDKCGLKGKRVGCARVSEEHANFILNEGTRSEDIARLVQEVKEEVFERTGILLREEIRRIP